MTLSKHDPSQCLRCLVRGACIEYFAHVLSANPDIAEQWERTPARLVVFTLDLRCLQRGGATSISWTTDEEDGFVVVEDELPDEHCEGSTPAIRMVVEYQELRDALRRREPSAHQTSRPVN